MTSCALTRRQAASRRRELQRQTLAPLVRPSPRCSSTLPRCLARPRRPPARRCRRQGRERSAGVEAEKSRVPGRCEPPAVQRSPGHRRRKGGFSADDRYICRRLRVVAVSSLRRRSCRCRCGTDDVEATWKNYQRPAAAAADAAVVDLDDFASSQLSAPISDDSLSSRLHSHVLRLVTIKS